MADTHSHTTLRGIDYRATFPFVHLFKGFRLAIDPSKIVLALVLLLAVYAGGRLMDAVWPERHRAVQGELDAYATNVARPGEFGRYREDRILDRQAEIRRQLAGLGHPDFPADHRHLVEALRIKRDDTVRHADEFYDRSAKAEADRDAREDAHRQAHADYAIDVERAKALASEGLFIHFLMYEVHTVDAIVLSAVNLNISGVIGGLGDLFITAPAWAFRFHPVYFILFFAFLLS